MKNILLAFTLLFWGNLVNAQGKSGDLFNEVTLAQKLKVAAKNISEKGSKYFKSPQDYLDTFSSLESSVKIVQQKPSEILMDAIAEYAGALAVIDNSGSVGRIVLPLWKSSQKESFKRSIGRLDPKSKNAIMLQSKIVLEGEKRGNG